MTYLPGFRHDIFVSYAHGPTYVGADEPLGRWTRRLKADLAAEIMINLGTKDPERRIDVWMDQRLAGNHPLTDTLKETVEQSALLLAIMSPFFLQGDWCANEVAWFSDANGRRGAGKERIFVVRTMLTDDRKWPPTLRDSGGHVLKGYPFYHAPTEIDDETRPFGWPVPHEGDQDYATAIRRLASDIARQIKSIDSRKQSVAVPAQTVFLGMMHDTVEVRDELRARLVAGGLAVLPAESDEAFDEASLKEQLDAHLGQCQALVLVANEYCTPWPKDQPGGLVGLQLQKADQLGVSSHVWLQAENMACIRRPSYRAFLESLTSPPSRTLRHGNVEAFVQSIIEGLRNAKPRAPEIVTETNAVICSNRPADQIVGLEFTNTLKEILRETGRDNYTFDFADPKAEQIKLANLEKRLRDADTVLVLCFDQDWDWARPLLRQLNLLNIVRNGTKSRLLVAGPRDMQEGLYDARTLGFETIDVVNIGLEEVKEKLQKELLTRLHVNGVGLPAQDAREAQPA